MKRIATLLLAGAALAMAADLPKTYTGVITDSMCGASHKAMKVSPDSKCVQECVRHGSKYALLEGGNVYVLSDQQAPARYAAQKVTVTGTLDAKTRTLKVASIQPAK